MIKFLKKVIKNYLRKRNAEDCARIASDFDFTPVKQEMPKGNKLAFVVSVINIYGGGINSVLQLAGKLSERGYEVYVVSLDEFDEKDINSKIRMCLGNTEVKGIRKDTFVQGKFDIIIATAWRTAYYIYPFQGYKMYFVQDFEPYFYERGDFYYLAYKSYSLGYHMISLGDWNGERILEDYPDAHVDMVCFPFDGDVYGNTERKYRSDGTINAAVYFRYTSRRLPFLTELICKNLVKKFAADGYELRVFYFGDDKKVKIGGGINLGKLKKKELAELYSKCDFGMVFSYTNISLVPYEMMATGLPLVELKEGTFTKFMPENAAALYDGDCEKLYGELKKRIFDEDYFRSIDEENKRLLKTFTWDRTADDFVRALNVTENKV